MNMIEYVINCGNIDMYKNVNIEIYVCSENVCIFWLYV